MRKLPTNGEEAVVEMPGKKKKLAFVPAKHMEKYGQSEESVTWEELAADRIKKYGKAGLALRGARVKEGISQKELAKFSGVSQENISKMENGERTIGEKVAKKLAKVLNMDYTEMNSKFGFSAAPKRRDSSILSNLILEI